MGISGHILGPRRMRRLNREFPGYDFDRAYRYHGPVYARAVKDGDCKHYIVGREPGLVEYMEDAWHWASCPRVERAYPKT